MDHRAYTSVANFVSPYYYLSDPWIRSCEHIVQESDDQARFTYGNMFSTESQAKYASDLIQIDIVAWQCLGRSVCWNSIMEPGLMVHNGAVTVIASLYSTWSQRRCDQFYHRVVEALPYMKDNDVLLSWVMETYRHPPRSGDESEEWKHARGMIEILIGPLEDVNETSHTVKDIEKMVEQDTHQQMEILKQVLQNQSVIYHGRPLDTSYEEECWGLNQSTMSVVEPGEDMCGHVTFSSYEDVRMYLDIQRIRRILMTSPGYHVVSDLRVGRPGYASYGLQLNMSDTPVMVRAGNMSHWWYHPNLANHARDRVVKELGKDRFLECMAVMKLA